MNTVVHHWALPSGAKNISRDVILYPYPTPNLVIFPTSLFPKMSLLRYQNEADVRHPGFDVIVSSW